MDGRIPTGSATVALLLVGACVAPLPPSAEESAKPVDTVAVAYGRMPRDRVTGAVSSLTEDEIESSHATRVTDLIQGRVPGVQVLRGLGGSATIRIRNAKGFGYSNEEPLVVIDGMPASSASMLDALMPQDITRIDVLKDAGSTAAYGVRGANGVILITTKRGPQ